MDVFIGTIVPWPISYAPPYFTLCQGQEYQVAQYQAVYSVIGSAFGGSPPTTFKIPDLRGRSVIGLGNYMGGQPVYNMGQSGGTVTNTFTLATNQVPAHSHAATFTPVMGTQTVTIPGSAAAGSLAVNVTGSLATAVAGNPAPSGTVYLGGLDVQDGGGGSMNVIGPYTSTSPTGTTATLGGLSASVTPSANYHPSSAPTTTTINTLTNGTVAIFSTPLPTPVLVNNMQPWLAMNFLFAMQGLYPMRP